MEQLESAARPFLTPLIQGRDGRLSPSQQTLLATWALKTAMVFDLLTAQPDTFFTADERYEFHLSPQPLDPSVLGVWLAAIVGMNHVASAIDYRVRFELGNNPFFGSASAYCSTISAGHAVVQVFAIRNFEDLRRVEPPFPVAAWHDAAPRIWPSDGAVQWPTARVLDPDGYSAFIDRWRPNR